MISSEKSRFLYEVWQDRIKVALTRAALMPYRIHKTVCLWMSIARKMLPVKNIVGLLDIWYQDLIWYAVSLYSVYPRCRWTRCELVTSKIVDFQTTSTKEWLTPKAVFSELVLCDRIRICYWYPLIEDNGHLLAGFDVATFHRSYRNIHEQLWKSIYSRMNRH